MEQENAKEHSLPITAHMHALFGTRCIRNKALCACERWCRCRRGCLRGHSLHSLGVGRRFCTWRLLDWSLYLGLRDLIPVGRRYVVCGNSKLELRIQIYLCWLLDHTHHRVRAMLRKVRLLIRVNDSEWL